MKKPVILLLFVIAILSQLSAQNIEEWIGAKKPLLFEKIYLHIDRELYAPGDPIWLKVYQLNGLTHQLNTNYRNIFIQLITENGQVARDLMLLSVNGQANGEFKTDKLKSGLYTIRAFTKYLEGFGEETFFHKKIWIVGSNNQAQDNEPAQPAIDISFLPEGGHLVLNTANTVAFKAIDQKGRGIYVTGKIVDELGDTITSFSSTYKGMGKFSIMPEDDATYFATVDKFPELKFALPKGESAGLSITHKMDQNAMLFLVSGNMFSNAYPSIYFIASHKGIILFHKEIEMDESSKTISIDQNLFPSGISKITLLDTNFQPIAERLVFVDIDKKDILHLGLNQQAFKPREQVKLEVDALLDAGDSIHSTLSMTVVNKNYLSTGESSQNIKSYLLLDAELKGGLESPAEYFMDDQFHTSAEKLDLLMMVNGWRSYLWDQVEQTTMPSLDDWNDAGITVTGYVKKLLRNAPSPETEVSFDYAFRYKNIGKTITDKDGRFAFRHTYLIDTLKVMLNATTAKDNHNTEIILDPLPVKDSVISPDLFSNQSFNIELNADFLKDNSFRRRKELEFNPEKGTTLLEGVNVVEKRKNAFVRSLGDYPWADRTITITKEDYHFMDVIYFLESSVGGITIEDETVKKGFWNMDLTVDGMPIDFKDTKTIRLTDVDIIDIINPESNKNLHMGSLGVMSKTGLIAIYMKKNYFVPKFDTQYKKGRIIPELRGFDSPDDFYSPKYTMENIHSPMPDLRPTLYWNPDVSIENGKATIDFFTSDMLADYVIYVEGITKKGKICFGTATFHVEKDNQAKGN